MRWFGIGMALLVLAGCSKAPDQDQAGETASKAGGLAFSYRYDVRLPSARISDAQELQAQACERLGARCRITGMAFNVDSSGRASAILDMSVASAIARTFGREGVKRVEAAGGALTGAEIIGKDTVPDIQQADASAADARTDRSEIDKRLAIQGLPAAERSELLTRRAALERQERDNLAAKAATQASVIFTPISFYYAAGSGVGLQAQLSEVANIAYASLSWTITTVLTLLAYLGPPLLLGLLLALAWFHVGRRWFARLFPADRDR
ncbi:MAG: hypothetical protein ACK4TC_00130 [Sphingomonas pseudosanguinis]|uniref:hypothetical protein n=1 Tax=Sphingomonas pseudosanguinis TaxID=413712 RepID=UPI00391B9CCF